MPSSGKAAVGGHAYGFGRSRRIRTSADFQGVSREGQRVSSRNFVMLVSPRECETRFGRRQQPGRVGLTVSRRVGGAVVRNRVKRRLREWYRMSELRQAAALDVVVIARPAAARLSFAVLRDDLDRLGGAAQAKVGS